MFCYAYYVTPPPTSGRIAIRKTVEGGASQVFSFDGNLSFNADGRFDITLNNQESAAAPVFYRAAGQTWTARELVPDGWTLTDLSCTQTGASSVVEALPAAEVSITLAARDNVVCTFTNAVRPPEGELFIEKITRGSTGLFNFEIFPAVEAGQSARRSCAHARSRTYPSRRSPAR